VTIASGGVLPKIHPELLQRKRGGKFGTGPSSPKPSQLSPAKHAKKAAANKKFTAKGKTAGRGSSKVVTFCCFCVISYGLQTRSLDY